MSPGIVFLLVGVLLCLLWIVRLWKQHSKRPEAQQQPGQFEITASDSSNETGTGNSKPFVVRRPVYSGRRSTHIDPHLASKLRREGKYAEAVEQLRAAVERLETEARESKGTVPPWCYEQLAMVYRKQRRYDDEVQILERYQQQAKAPGVSAHNLMLRLETARALQRDGGYGPTYSGLRVKRSKLRTVVVNTPLGMVEIDNRHHRPAVVIGLGRAEDHLRWYYNVHRREVLERAIANLVQVSRGEKDVVRWSDSYFEFALRAPAELDDLPQELERVLEENRRQVAKREIQVLGTYDSMEQAVEAARFLVQKYQPTPQAGWLDVHAVAIPKICDVPV